MSKESVATTLRQWEQLLAAWEANAEAMGFFDAERAELRTLVERVQDLVREQAALNAKKQQVTRDLDAAKDRGRELASRMRAGVHTRYGLSGEKLLAFGLRPRRGAGGRKRSKPPNE
ncbi:MAG: hypothetical protein ACJ75H_02065 [Thermoanaerobaculia bacterium]